MGYEKLIFQDLTLIFLSYGLLKCEKPGKSIELILCANTIPHERREFLDRHGIDCKEIGIPKIEEIARKNGYEFIENRKPEKPKTSVRRNEVTMGGLDTCEHCRFSITELKEMAEKDGRKEMFTTFGGQAWMNIYEVNTEDNFVTMRRSTGNITRELRINVLVRIHDAIHNGETDLDSNAIDNFKIEGRKVAHMWGNYVAGLLRHLGCRKIVAGSSPANIECQNLPTKTVGGGGIKVTRLKYPTHSTFLDPCKEVIRKYKDNLLAGNIITVHLSPEGYNRQVIATIEADDYYNFWVDWDGPADRCGARIRAAAKALFELKFFGEFEIIHKTGILTMRIVSLMDRES
jgi:hypothetical protein